MKKFGKLTVLALTLLCMAMLISTVSSAADLKDIKGHWAEEYIEYGVEAGYISGYENGTFLPDKTVTRAEFSKMLNNAIKITSAGNARGDFKDVDEKQWYFEEVRKAEYAGYITGYDDGTFKPNNPITRQEAAVILSRVVLPIIERAGLDTFGDGEKIDSWAKDAVSMIAAKGYIKGDENGNFIPKGALTRSQAAKLICELVKNENVVNQEKIVETEEEEFRFSETLFTDNVVIIAPKGTTVIFENCRVLGTVSVESEEVFVEFENSFAKEVDFEAKDVTVSVDKTSTVKNANIYQPATLSGNGFQNVYVDGDDLGSDKITLKGTFVNVYIESDAVIAADVVDTMTVEEKVNLVLQSGNISKLEVESGAKNSSINLAAKKVVIEKAENKGAVTYIGSGTIELSNNAVAGVVYDGVTVDQTTGKKAEGDNTPAASDDDFFKDMTITPKSKATKVELSSNITLTFDEKVYNNEKEALKADYVEDNFELRRGSSTGTKTGFSATVTSSKKIVINPTSSLKASTKYYVVIPKGVLLNGDDEENDEFVSYFTTAAASDEEGGSGDEGDNTSVDVEFTPENGDSTSVNPEIVVTFSEKVYKNAKKSALTDEYCETTAFEIRKGTTSGDEIDFSANVASTYKKVTLIPDEILEPDQKYYVILNKKLYDSDGDLIAKKTSYFKTEGGLSVTITPEDGATNVSTSPEIFFEFSEGVKYYNGDALDADTIVSVVEIREKTKSGTAVGFKAECISEKKFRVYIPENNSNYPKLVASKKYCIVLKKGLLVGKDSGEENEEILSYFTVAGAMAPMITPVDGAKNVAATKTPIKIEFSQPLYTVTSLLKNLDIEGKTGTIELFPEYITKGGYVTLRVGSENGTPIACEVDVTVGEKDTVITLTPDSNLAVNKDYYVVVKSGCFTNKEARTKNLAATTTFSTNEALTPTFNVDNNQKGVEVDEVFTISFDENIFNPEGDPLDMHYVADSVVSLYKKADGEEVECGIKVAGKKITVTPVEDLEGGTEYVLLVKNESIFNSSNVKNKECKVTFKTESKVVKTITYDPESGAKNVSVAVNPVIKFASPIYKSTGGSITEIYVNSRILLYENKYTSTATPIDATVVFDKEEAKTFTIELADGVKLKTGTKYCIYIALGFAYEDGSTISAKSVYFTTSEYECSECSGPHKDADHECSFCGEKGHEATEKKHCDCGKYECSEEGEYCKVCREHVADTHCFECHLDDGEHENDCSEADDGEGEGGEGTQTPGDGGDGDNTQTPGDDDNTQTPGDDGDDDNTQTPGDDGDDNTQTPGDDGDDNTQTPGDGGDGDNTQTPGDGGDNDTQTPVEE